MEYDIGHGVRIQWDADGGGIRWKHECRVWQWLRFRPDSMSTGHTRLAGSIADTAALSIGGSLICQSGCGKHGHVTNGRWVPC
jgi:hypothetical protein